VSDVCGHWSELPEDVKNVFRSSNSRFVAGTNAFHGDGDSTVAEYFVCKFYWLPVVAWHAVHAAGLHTSRSLREFF
jgi:hypothetical protein